MQLSEFARRCQTDHRLAAAWDRLIKAAHDRITLEISRVFQGVSSPDHSSSIEFRSARENLIAQCKARNISPPDLSLKQFIELLLQYQ